MNNIKKSWNNIIDKYNIKYKNESIDNILLNLKNQSNDYNIYPKIDKLFKCFEYFDIENTKIVILGQDPYHTQNIATGLCFGIDLNNSTHIPPSIKNINKELKNDLDIELNDYTLNNWAKQGILLLNTSLSVIENNPGSHIKLWNNFTKYIIEELNNCEHSIIFVSWGAFSYNKLKNIDTTKHTLLVSSHPSPLSVYKKFKEFPAFYGSKPFSKINNILHKQNKETIIW